MTSHKPGKCCTQGFVHQGEASGTFRTIGSSECYISYPPSKLTTKAILFLTDVFGHTFINSHLLADQMAADGYFVCMPDLFHDDPAPLDAFSGTSDFNIGKWFPNRSHETVQPIFDAVREALRGDFGVKSLGAVGYCFGAKYVVRGLSPEGGLNAGFIAHPSGVESAELRAIKGPLSIAAAESDYVFTDEQRHESEAILKEIGVHHQVNVYGGTSHGFAVRADLSGPEQRYAKEQAYYQAVTWFDEHLSVQGKTSGL